MTDQYGTDGDHEAAGHDEVTEAEPWQDDQPPVDDFADQPLDETATVSEEEGELPQDDQTGTAIEEKKRSLMLPIAAGLGGLLFLGAVLYWQFGTSSSTAPVIKPPPLSTAQMEPSSHFAPVPAPNSNAGNLAAASSASVAPTTSLPSAVETPSAPAPTMGVAVPTASPAVIAAAPPLATLSPETLAKAPPAPMTVPTGVPSSAAVGVMATSSLANDSVDARLSALTSHVEDLQKALAQTTQQLSQISNMVAAKAPLATGSPSSDSATEERLNKIEQQVLQIQHAEPVSASSPVVTQETATAVVADTTPEKPVSTSRVTHKHKASPAKHVTHKAVTHATAPPATHWVLRAATPGEAWISNGESADEFRHVQVGDSLAGIGRIEAIRQNGDSWVVEGSQGSLH